MIIKPTIEDTELEDILDSNCHYHYSDRVLQFRDFRGTNGQRNTIKKLKAREQRIRLEAKIEALARFAPPIEERQDAGSFHESVYVTKTSWIDDAIEALESQLKKEG